jgi:ribose/xylose/arabinose/galactoside ABC-type transport system permease subunit
MLRTLLGVVTFSVLNYGLNRITWVEDLMRPFLLGVVLMVALVINGLLGRRR